MMRLFFTLFFMISFSGICFSQKKLATYISADVIMVKEKFLVANYGLNSRMNNTFLGNSGFQITQQLYKSIFAEIGFASRFIGGDHDTYYAQDTSRVIFASNILQLPLRVSYRKAFLNKRFYIYPSAGIQMNITDRSNSIIRDNVISIEGKYIGKSFIGYDFGIGTDLFLSKTFSIGLAYRYTTSFKTIADYKVRVLLDDGTNEVVQIANKGTSEGLNIRIQWMISTLWNK